MGIRTNDDHYVSQFHLKLFANDVDRLYVLDSKTKALNIVDNASKTKIKFFSEKNWSSNQKIENTFGEVETKVAPIFRQLAKTPNLINGYSKLTRSLMLEYIRINYIRALETAKGMHDSMKVVEDATIQMVGSDSFRLANIGIKDMNRDEELTVFAKTSLRLLETLEKKHIIVAVAPKGAQFIISDISLSKISIIRDGRTAENIDDASTIFWMPISPKVGFLFINSKHKIPVAHINKKLTKGLNKSQICLALHYIAGGNNALITSLSRFIPINNPRAIGSILSEGIIEINNTNSWHSFTDIESREIERLILADDASI